MHSSRFKAIAVGVATAAIVAAFGAVELAVRLAGIEPDPWPFAGPHEISGAEADPLLGAVPLPGWSGRWSGDFPVETDDRRFRVTAHPPPEFPRARIAFLGDSCTFGWGVNTPETYVARIDELQRRNDTALLELINAGYPGNSAIIGLHMLEERVLPLEPDIVVLAFSANNAFRLALASDAERFRFFRTRKLALRSRLVEILASRVANLRSTMHPRNREAVARTPLSDVRRVAGPGDFERALRRLVVETRAGGARVVFLLMPRAVEVTDEHRYEDAALNLLRKALPLGSRAEPPGKRELRLIEASCLDPRQDDVRAVLRERMGNWRPVRPQHAGVRRKLQRGAIAFKTGDYARARSHFAAVVRRQSDSPLALYALGVVDLESGRTDAGLERLDRADRLACNVFLQYQVILRHVAAELDVPVVDGMLLFMAHDGESLYLDQDPAHPNPRGHALIAEALWPVLRETVSQLPDGRSVPRRTR